MRQERWDQMQIERAEADDAAWRQWLDDLERIMSEWDAKYHNLPYTLPLKDSTGLECWAEFYADGYTPERTFGEDQQSWV